MPPKTLSDQIRFVMYNAKDAVLTDVSEVWYLVLVMYYNDILNKYDISGFNFTNLVDELPDKETVRKLVKRIEKEIENANQS